MMNILTKDGKKLSKKKCIKLFPSLRSVRPIEMDGCLKND